MQKKKYKRIINKNKSQSKSILSDVNGSYTGVPINSDKPVQDADDL